MKNLVLGLLIGGLSVAVLFLYNKTTEQSLPEYKSKIQPAIQADKEIAIAPEVTKKTNPKEVFNNNLSGVWKSISHPDMWYMKINPDGTFEDHGFNLNSESADKNGGKYSFDTKNDFSLLMLNPENGEYLPPFKCKLKSPDDFNCTIDNGVEKFTLVYQRCESCI